MSFWHTFDELVTELKKHVPALKAAAPACSKSDDSAT